MSEKKLGNAIVVDTNLLIHQPALVDSLRVGDDFLIIPYMVWHELGRSKNSLRIGHAAREAMRRIEEAQLNNAKNMRLDYSGESLVKKIKGLKPENPDHVILATAFAIAEKEPFGKVLLLTKDRDLRVPAREIIERAARESDKKVVVEKYNGGKIDEGFYKSIPEISVPDEVKNEEGFLFEHEAIKLVFENDGVVCRNSEGYEFLALRKGERFRVVEPYISAFGVTPQSVDGKKNWPQVQLLAQLLDPDIKFVAAVGRTGSGKTLLSMAAALERKDLYRQIRITNPMVPLKGKDLGFLPGDVEEKTNPWKEPIDQACAAIKGLKRSGVKGGQSKDRVENTKELTKLWEDGKIVFGPMSFLRGVNLHKDILLLDDAQNAYPSDVKTIITRAGEGAKIVFAGDPNQIDQPDMDALSCGLVHVVRNFHGSHLVGVTYLPHVVRSELARLAEEKL